MKKILVIGTGGTIASKQMGEGLSPALSAPEILTYVPEVERLCEIDVLQICNIDSTNITPKIWIDIAGNGYYGIHIGCTKLYDTKFKKAYSNNGSTKADKYRRY